MGLNILKMESVTGSGGALAGGCFESGSGSNNNNGSNSNSNCGNNNGGFSW